MEPITALAGLKAVQEVSSLVKRAIEPAQPEKSSQFDSVLRSMLQPDGQDMVNEEELFAALMQERIGKLKGEEAAGKFKEFLEKYKDEFRRPDGITSVEKAANHAMDAMVEAGLLTGEEGDSITLQSFNAAQLDDNTSALFDGRGSEGDPTIAVQKMEAALLSAQTMIQKFESGEAVPTTPRDGDTLGTDSTGNVLSDEKLAGSTVKNPNDGAEGFLYKPESDSDSKLVVLLPASMTGNVDWVKILDEKGNELEMGRYSDVANGGREHFRFNKPGGAYGESVRVAVKMNDGSFIVYNIDDASQRYD